MRLTLDEITTHAPHIATFWFKPERKMEYIAGQFIDLTLPQMTGEERNRRWFTLSSSPTEERLAITTQIGPQNSSIYKRTLSGLTPGDIVAASEPMGDFVLPMQRTTPILFVAGGMGITPVRSIIKWLHDQRQHRPIQLLHAVHEPADVLFDDIVTNYGIQPTYIASEPNIEWKHSVGRINAAQLISLSHPEGYIYISGPESMTERLVDELREMKFPTNRVVTDYFPGYPAL
jgi:ferredoxin-NADP reductase